jgi:hypothetical protein
LDGELDALDVGDAAAQFFSQAVGLASYPLWREKTVFFRNLVCRSGGRAQLA